MKSESEIEAQDQEYTEKFLDQMEKVKEFERKTGCAYCGCKNSLEAPQCDMCGEYI